MKTRQAAAAAEVRPTSDDGPSVTLTRAELRDLMRAAVVDALAEFDAGKPSAPALLSGAEMATQLGISRSKLHELRVGGLPAIKLGDSYKYEPSVVLQHLREASGK